MAPNFENDSAAIDVQLPQQELRARKTAQTATVAESELAPAPKAARHTAADDELEFGGPVGAGLIMLVSHVLLYYVFYVLHFNGGALWLPTSLAQLQAGVATLVRETAPTVEAAALYFSFLGVMAVLAFVMPGVDIRGRPDVTGRVLHYRCNAYASWWVSLGVLAALHATGVFSLSTWYDQLGPVMTCAVIWGDVFSAVLYLSGLASGAAVRMTGNHVYDFFMGSVLHPRVGTLDIKMFAEIRVSWFLLFINTTSCAVKQYETLGYVTPSMAFLVLAHFLYANATAKGEHYVPGTWDIFYEKFGWMLCFWNFAGVPFLYCKQAHYLISHGSPDLPAWVVPALTVALLGAYYIWDESQQQKNHFRLTSTGANIRRNTFPSMPNGILRNPKVITTAAGTPLLVDGWWAVARKIHYTADTVMALTWGLACGLDAFIPYLYVFFFTAMILHRFTRDQARCAAKYGADWVAYCAAVPYAFIPGVF